MAFEDINKKIERYDRQYEIRQVFLHCKELMLATEFCEKKIDKSCF
jgi:hypothetical protein